jgi:DNA-binding MarR family transcriptional regulator
VDTSGWVAALYMVVLGLGLGMVMQVLVLAVQNAVDYRFLGVATSGSTLFRQVGGSIGVALFGAIFSNRLADELAQRLPRGAHVTTAANPAVVHQLPAALHTPYVAAFAAALQPVFLVATVISLCAFALTWLLREVPLRQTASAEGVGESFASPREDSSERELERILGSLMQREGRRRTYEELIRHSGVELTPEDSWVLGRLGERRPISASALARALDVPVTQLRPPIAELERQAYVRALDGDELDLSDGGRAALDTLIAAGRAHLCDLLDGWEPERDEELGAALDRLARALVAEMPAPA